MEDHVSHTVNVGVYFQYSNSQPLEGDALQNLTAGPYFCHKIIFVSHENGDSHFIFASHDSHHYHTGSLSTYSESRGEEMITHS